MHTVHCSYVVLVICWCCSVHVHCQHLCCVYFLVIDTQLVTNNTTLINTIVFPNDTIATKFGGVQITIPSSALQLALQRLTEGKDLSSATILTMYDFLMHTFRCSGNSSELCCKQFTAIHQ